MGCLLGSQSGRTVDISNSFEMRYLESSAVDIDHAFLLKKMEQCGCWSWAAGRGAPCAEALFPPRRRKLAAAGHARPLLTPCLCACTPVDCRQADLPAAGCGGVVRHRRRHN